MQHIGAVSITTDASSAALPATLSIDATGSAQTGLAPSAAAVRAPTTATSTAYEASRVVKAAAGTLYGLAGYNSLASAQFILIFDSATVPADAAQAVFVISAQASSNFSVDFGVYGRPFTAGISISNSTTAPTKTIGVANCFFDARYK